MSNSPVKFNMGILGLIASMMQNQNQGNVTPGGMFGAMGTNPSINALSNANALSNNISKPQNDRPQFQNNFGLPGMFNSGGDMMGNVMMNTLARKAARRRRREVSRLDDIDPNISISERQNPFSNMLTGII